MEMKSTRRIVTGHDASGKAVVLVDEPVNAIQRSAGGNGMSLLWVTNESPVDMSGSNDRAKTPVKVPPPDNGTIFRIVDFAPTPTGGYGAHDHNEILRNMGIDDIVVAGVSTNLAIPLVAVGAADEDFSVTVATDRYHTCMSVKCGCRDRSTAGSTKVSRREAELRSEGQVLPSA